MPLDVPTVSYALPEVVDPPGLLAYLGKRFPVVAEPTREQHDDRGGHEHPLAGPLGVLAQLQEPRGVVRLPQLSDPELEDERAADPDDGGEDVDEHDPQVEVLVERQQLHRTSSQSVLGPRRPPPPGQADDTAARGVHGSTRAHDVGWAES